MKNEELASSYVTDKNFIRIKADKTDFLLKIQDNKTLISVGFIKGAVYHKK